MVLSICTPTPVSSPFEDSSHCSTLTAFPGGQSNDPFGSEWVVAHGQACVDAGKPCVFEEYGVQSDKCTVEGKWQDTALNTTGIAADNFWDFGTTLSWGQTNNDGNTIFTNTSDWTCLVTNHVAKINN